MSVEPTRIASAPASSAAAPWARDSIPLSAMTTRSRGALATSRSCSVRSISNVARSRALIPMTGARSATARSSSSRVVGLDERLEPEIGGGREESRHLVVVEIAQQQERRIRAGLACRAQVVGAREEALREQRQRGRGARRAQVVPRAAEALVDEDRDRSRPARSYAAAIVAGSASGRRSPADGERRLTSAIAVSPGRASASANRPITGIVARTRRAQRGVPSPRRCRWPRARAPGLPRGRSRAPRRRSRPPR